MDLDAIYFELQRHKNERAWHNLNLSRDRIAALLGHPDWYVLYIPEDQLAFDSFERVRRWQEIAVVLLKRYCDRYYRRCKAEWESGHLEYRELTEDDPNFIPEYRFLIERSREEIVTRLEELRDLVASGALRDFQFQNITAHHFDRHLYCPLVHVASGAVEVRPVVLENAGERDFVRDLRAHCEANPGYFEDEEGKDIILVR